MFADEYLLDLNGPRAWAKVYQRPYPAPTQKDANRYSSASNLILSKPEVQAYLHEQFTAARIAAGISAEKVLSGLANIAFFDIRTLQGESGALKPVHEWDDVAATVVAGIDVYEEFATVEDGDGKPHRDLVGYTKKIKLPDRNKAIENLGRYFKLFTDVVEQKNDMAAMEEMARIKADNRRRLEERRAKLRAEGNGD